MVKDRKEMRCDVRRREMSNWLGSRLCHSTWDYHVLFVTSHRFAAKCPSVNLKIELLQVPHSLSQALLFPPV